MPLWFRVATFAVMGALLLVDLAVVARRPRTPTLRECALWVAFYLALAGGFAGLLFVVGNASVSGAFVAGWLTEYSLSVDNLFVFVLIMAQFAVPRRNQQKVLMLGIILSLLLRGACIVAGAAAIERFGAVFYLFGGFLVVAAVRLARSGRPGADGAYRSNAIVRRASRAATSTTRPDGARAGSRRRTHRVVSPLLIVMLAIGSTDLLFALDSIPAIFGLTRDPFVVFTATLFALMGLRQLYFLLGGLLERLVYLSTGLAVVLGFIGLKLMLTALRDNGLPFIHGGRPLHAVPCISIGASLATIVGVLAVTAGASLLRSRSPRRGLQPSGKPPAPRPGAPAAPRPVPAPAAHGVARFHRAPLSDHQPRSRH